MAETEAAPVMYLHVGNVTWHRLPKILFVFLPIKFLQVSRVDSWRCYKTDGTVSFLNMENIDTGSGIWRLKSMCKGDSIVMSFNICFNKR
jgi:hypothetical protein